MGTQVPKGLGIGMMLVGVPLVLWDASRTSDELNTLNTEASSRNSRVETCIQEIGPYGVPPSKQPDMCNCLVDTAVERGVTGRYGSYDEAGLEKVIKSCAWELGL
ncbi:hypothetical protein [uncultured Erythrobacter sp.]|uniref:hypothetical protein n=1 Tax=uncultured Erythrobacter sp. TaxID=263913 RepID=UPI002630AD70|nr:hypothetical protein [uncultured Erythrobacter sp.]